MPTCRRSSARKAPDKQTSRLPLLLLIFLPYSPVGLEIKGQGDSHQGTRGHLRNPQEHRTADPGSVLGLRPKDDAPAGSCRSPGVYSCPPVGSELLSAIQLTLQVHTTPGSLGIPVPTPDFLSALVKLGQQLKFCFSFSCPYQRSCHWAGKPQQSSRRRDKEN